MQEERLITRENRQKLLKLARSAIAAKLSGQDPSKLVLEFEMLSKNMGAFVTLHLRGSLRGCIGVFEGRESLTDTIKEMAQAAAFSDPRFPPIATQSELSECDIEISVLSPLRKADPEDIEVGRHGVCVSRGFNRGVLLPQVATEQGWDKETFLNHCCLKAGLPTNAWRQKDTKIECFTAEVFGEHDFEK